MLGLGLPAVGIITPERGQWLVVAAVVFVLTIILTPLEHRARHWILNRIPIEFRSPVARKPRTPGPVRPPAALGALDFELRMTQASDTYAKALGRLSQDTEWSGSITKKHTPRVQAVAMASTERKIAASRAYAREQSKCIDAMEKRAREVAAAGADLRENSLQRLRAFPADADLSPLRERIATLRQTVDGSRESLAGLRAAVALIRAQNLQQAINDVSDRHLDVLDGILLDFDAMRDYVRDALAEIDKRGGPPVLGRAERRRRERARTP